ncbi:MAG: zinc transporter [Gammaproteobacteria bacterium RIFCSPLOWO2_02_FULL_42_14]|nr:MAG: zinc transporter [Gammaproteobacteria bacterium RIFCSPHIGHO2_02_FULL_42_43]OGT27742.1 MAG: zinc transporter [Gammaproteobacteria bacterium RIFCSPHIGHO2_01_FULL_42_8]OGT53040.1 MAG: zinc transporter [Gammaproteobacteria bacterium RIFCSPHIGHO2_12_FULL_41_25]OGT61187.1 MAG: zinc transporter [Gammaproteobacteria bacterium RIFCSPLOWO2_02_FULL_42_14]OGT87114.1 MAG: zinc transporter [Gammaproteobacteria bacterium RIFCSPLOWO2_12_FULL_42_18]
MNGLFELFNIAIIFSVTVLAGIFPFFKKKSDEASFPSLESLAAGVFLGAALIHMLGDASSEFYRLSWHYPIAFVLAGAMFLFLLWLEHIGKEIVAHNGETSNAFAYLATLMLSVHAFLMGAALGLSTLYSVAVVILLAIVAHKWAESLALSIQINKTRLSRRVGLTLFSIFSLMTPLGIAFGVSAQTLLKSHALLQPIFSALAAGTFLYLGTLHGLEKATLIKQCCDLRRFYFVIVGFSIMAIVALWI